MESVLGPGLRTLVDGLDHPEAVCWSPAEQLLYAGGEAGQVYRFPVEGGEAEHLLTIPGGNILGMAFDASGALYACDPGNQCVQRITPDGSYEPYGGAINYPNYPTFDSEGRMWVSDSGDWDGANGAVVCIDADGRAEQVADGLNFSNGTAIKDDWLYVAQSCTTPGIVRMPLAGGEPESVIVLERAVPDGIAFDEKGGLWIGCWQPNRVYRLDPDGTLDTIVDDWMGVFAPTPTNVAFCGAELDVLALASLGTPTVAAIDSPFRGAALNYPAGPDS